MSAQRVTITYSGPIVFLSTDHWKQIQNSLVSQLPLRNLHWKSTSRNALRSIQELDVKLVPFEMLREDQAASQIPQSVLEKPLLHLYIFTCEDSEVYRTTVRKQLKEWHASVSTRKNQEWLIIHVVRPDQSVAQGRLFQMKTSVLDKVKADFNLDKKDRCVQLVWSAEKDNPAVWADTISKIKEGVLSSFDAALAQREEEVKRSEGQRQMPGWNFCTFFILKESVASSLEGMNLHEDALQQYYELESIFFQVLREKNLSWFGALITPMPTDDSSPLLSVTKKPYRDLILANTISVFDFRVYLLARQCILLSKIGDMEELCRKAASFLSTFSRTLRDVENTLPPFFIESWIYSSALSVVDQSDEWAKRLTLDKAALSAFNAAKGELLELARQQLDVLGIATGFLPNKPPFSLALPSTFDPADKDPKTKRGSMTITKTELLSSMEDQDTLYELYVNVTNRAIELYASAGRRKFALKLHGSLAALDIHRGRLVNALQTYTSLPAHYSPHGWTSMEAYMLNRALSIHEAAEKPKDREWIHVLLHFLRAYVDDGGKDLLLSEEDCKAYVEKLVAALKEAAQTLDNDTPFPDHPALSVSLVEPHAKLAESRDGALLQVVVNNRLPCDVPAEEVRLQLTGRENSQITFTAKVSSIAPGRTELTLFCPSSAMGTYALANTQISMPRLLFQWRHSKTPKQIKAGNMPTLVYIPKDARALDVRLKQPPLIELGTMSRIRVLLSTGRNEVATASVKLSAPSGIKFQYEDTQLIGEDTPAIRTDAQALTFLDLKAGQTVVAAVPHSDASAYAYMRINITVDYVTTTEPDITRTLRLSRVVATGLPVEINVQDFFRGTRLFTAFTLSTKTHQHVRVRSAQLLSDSETTGVRVKSCVGQKPGIVTLTPQQPGRFLFQMDSEKGTAREGLKLKITYRMLREEVESLIEIAVSEVVSEQLPLEPHRQDLTDKLVQALETNASWVELYGVTGELAVPGVTLTEDEFGAGLRQVMEKLNRKRSPTSFGEWRDIVIPVDVPQIHILASARLQILENPFSAEVEKAEKRTRPLYAGQPISALLTIKTSFHWAPPEDTRVQSYNMRYDIEDLTQDWLVSGRKRGDFVAKDGETFSTPVTLIALHHGELALPKVGVNALPLPGEHRMRSSVVPSCETYEVHGAEKVLVLPRGGRSTFVVNMGTNTSM
ncbi:trafficking protein particle complex subunit 10 [Dichomitus squalens]|uniref:Trafficking protein particle complex subunit 10 n=1 Tax=Dichomitus squalens TaxID=114155 RepID=A0A4Q9N6V4_9APHY|nr:trafficking protein particle complex subunit 10 [Dichomitus squalens]